MNPLGRQGAPRRRPFSDLIAAIVATGCGLGYAPVAPGTVGSLAGVALFWWLGSSWLPGGLLCLGLMLVGIWAGWRLEQKLRLKDPSLIVIDEIVGQFVTLWVASTSAAVFDLGPATHDLVFVALGFGLFRLFDITKPPPVRQLERLGRGVGVMADDVMAGVYAGFTLHLIHWWGML